MKSTSIGGTTNSSDELIVFNGAGNYPRIQIRGIDDGTLDSVQLGRNGASGRGYMRLMNGGDHNTGILLDGSGKSYINGDNVGIGTTDPSQKLDVDGNINCTGDVEAAKVYSDESFRVQGGAGEKGIFWEYGTTGYGWRIYPNLSYTWSMIMRSGHNSTGAIAGCCNNSTPRGYIYWNSFNEIGFLTAARDWSLRIDNNKHCQIYGSLGVGAQDTNYKLYADGNSRLKSANAYIEIKSSHVRITNNQNESYLHFQNGGHHIDTYSSSNGAGRRFYINYYANQGVTLTRSSITSDDRIKEEEKFIENATDTLLKLRPQTYIKYAPVKDGSTIKSNFDLSGNFESGLIAQEIYYDAPELRHIVEVENDKGDTIIPSSDDPQKDPDYSSWGDMTAGVNYIQLIPYIIKSNQELHERILKTENTQLKTDISFIKTENTELKRQIIQLTTDISMIRNHIGI